jgi:hypothetical protein
MSRPTTAALSGAGHWPAAEGYQPAALMIPGPRSGALSGGGWPPGTARLAVPPGADWPRLGRFSAKARKTARGVRALPRSLAPRPPSLAPFR